MSPMYEIAKSEFNFALIVFGSVLVVFGIVFAIFFFTVVKKKMPYYSMKKAAYLLTHFKA